MILRFLSSQLNASLFNFEMRTKSDNIRLILIESDREDCDPNSQLKYLVITIQTYQDVTNTGFTLLNTFSNFQMYLNCSTEMHSDKIKTVKNQLSDRK